MYDEIAIQQIAEEDAVEVAAFDGLPHHVEKTVHLQERFEEPKPRTIQYCSLDLRKVLRKAQLLSDPT